MDPARRDAVAALLAATLLTAGCGAPGRAPEAAPPPPPAADLETFLEGLRTSSPDGRRGPIGYRLGAAGDWRAVILDAPRRGFRVFGPGGAPDRNEAPRRILAFSEGRDRVVLHPEGSGRMAFTFVAPEGMRPLPAAEGRDRPLHFPGVEVWVCRPGQDLVFDWDGWEEPGWLGELVVRDREGERIPVEGQLTLPAGWVGVPSGLGVLRIGTDRVFGPYSEVETGVWTSSEDSYPMEVTFLPGIFLDISRRLGPRPGRMPEIVVDSCGDCPRPEGLPPLAPAGRGDERVLWIRLGSPGYPVRKPGPLYTEPLRVWIRTAPDDPTGRALIGLYAQMMAPVVPMMGLPMGLSFLPPPGLSRPLAEILRDWRENAPGPDARTLAEEILPGILFECRSADPEGFDRAVEELVQRHEPVRFHDLVEVLGRLTPRSLTPLRTRGLVD